MSIISRLITNNGSRRSFKLSPLEMLILGLIAVVVFYLISLWITGAFEPARQATPAAAPAQLLDRALAATERAQARMLTIEKKLAALDDRMDEIASQKTGDAKPGANPRLNQRLDALDKKVAALGKGGPAPDLAPLEARVLSLEKTIGDKPAKESLEQRLAGLETRLDQVARAANAPSASPSQVDKITTRLAEAEQKLDKVAKAANAPAATPMQVEKLTSRLAGVEQHLDKVARAANAPAKAPAELKEINDRLRALETRPMAAGQAPAKAAVPQDLDDRLRKLEKTLDKVEPSEAHNAATLADLETRMQNLERATPKAGAAAGVAAASLALMETRLQKFEATLQQTSESLRKVRAPVADPELNSRLERLEKQSQVADRDAKQGQRVNELDQRLGEIDKRLAALDKAQAITSRHLADMKEGVVPSSAPPRASAPEEKPPPKAKMLTHKVRRGQTLYGLARRYGVSVDDIRRWNPRLLNRKNLWVNEDLVIYTER
ncbi:hypothetical protein AAU61_01425 [Desulfocarbo indianensis]|nr:hypothetical protein AAU61_01425 [Desulfocarbo indianensis]